MWKALPPPQGRMHALRVSKPHPETCSLPQARLVSVLTQLDVSRSEVRRLRLEIRRMKAGAGAAPTAQ